MLLKLTFLLIFTNCLIFRFPRPQPPAFHVFPAIAGDTIAITFVSYAVSVSLAMIYADKHGYSIHPNQVTIRNIAAACCDVRWNCSQGCEQCVLNLWFQELLAHGISNTVSSFFTCFPSSATLATTNILESAGGYTQVLCMKEILWTIYSADSTTNLSVNTDTLMETDFLCVSTCSSLASSPV